VQKIYFIRNEKTTEKTERLLASVLLNSDNPVVSHIAMDIGSIWLGDGEKGHAPVGEHSFVPRKLDKYGKVQALTPMPVIHETLEDGKVYRKVGQSLRGAEQLEYLSSVIVRTFKQAAKLGFDAPFTPDGFEIGATAD
jgi:hypothetical protein